MKCDCEKYLNPIRTFDELNQRIKESSDLKKNLIEIASNQKWMRILQCKVCKRYWAMEYPFAEMHGGGPECLYYVECDDPKEWLNSHDNTLIHLKSREEDSTFFNSLGVEMGPEKCAKEECLSLRIKNAIFCRRHHFESIKKKVCPF